MKKALIISNLTIDHNRTESGKFTGPGGPAFFCASTMQNLGGQTVVYSPYGRDFPIEFFDKTKTRVIPSKPSASHTLIFQNVYQSHGERTQSVSNYNNLQFRLPSSHLLGDAHIIIVAPILPNVSKPFIVQLKALYPTSLFVLLPQGYYRKIEPDNTISYHDWDDPEHILSYFDIVIFSDKDDRCADEKAMKWSRGGPLVVITKEERGCSVFSQGKKENFPAMRVQKIIDSTGSGDIFSAAFAYEYVQSLNYQKSASFANAVAGFSLRFTADKLQYNRNDMKDVLKGGRLL